MNFCSAELLSEDTVDLPWVILRSVLCFKIWINVYCKALFSLSVAPVSARVLPSGQKAVVCLLTNRKRKDGVSLIPYALWIFVFKSCTSFLWLSCSFLWKMKLWFFWLAVSGTPNIDLETGGWNILTLDSFVPNNFFKTRKGIYLELRLVVLET